MHLNMYLINRIQMSLVSIEGTHKENRIEKLVHIYIELINN